MEIPLGLSRDSVIVTSAPVSFKKAFHMSLGRELVAASPVLFDVVKGLLVCHVVHHNDTMCPTITTERKMNNYFMNHVSQ